MSTLKAAIEAKAMTVTALAGQIANRRKGNRQLAAAAVAAVSAATRPPAMRPETAPQTATPASGPGAAPAHAGAEAHGTEGDEATTAPSPEACPEVPAHAVVTRRVRAMRMLVAREEEVVKSLLRRAAHRRAQGAGALVGEAVHSAPRGRPKGAEGERAWGLHRTDAEATRPVILEALGVDVGADRALAMRPMPQPPSDPPKSRAPPPPRRQVAWKATPRNPAGHAAAKDGVAPPQSPRYHTTKAALGLKTLVVGMRPPQSPRDAVRRGP